MAEAQQQHDERTLAKKAQAEAEHRLKVMERRQQVTDFLAWWDAGVAGDPFFREKMPAAVRRITPIVAAYLMDVPDAAASEWYWNHAKKE